MTKHLKEAERLKKIVEAFPNVTVTVLGDLVADEFVFGEISRVSREAPVLILKHRERTFMPGGAANAANNLADLGVNVLPVGIVGDDEPGRMLLKYFRHKRIPVSGVLKDKSYTTVTKTRILAGMTHTARQQVVRVDREPQQAPNATLDAGVVPGGAGIMRMHRTRCWFPTTDTERPLRRSSMRCGKKASWDRCQSSWIRATACCSIPA